MKNKAPLSLIEQVIMLLVLAVAAVICLQVFLWADRQADQNSLLDNALQQVQNTAEVLKSTGGDLQTAANLAGGHLENGQWIRSYTEYQIRITPLESDHDLLGMAQITAESGGHPLTELTVCWQEVAP